MIEANLQAVIAALSIHIRDFRGMFDGVSYSDVYDLCIKELKAAKAKLITVVSGGADK